MTPTAKSNHVNFFSDDFYIGASSIPEGNYAVYFDFQYHPADKGNKPRFGVNVTAYPLEGGPKKEKFLSMGEGAAAIYRPDPTNSKKFIVVPGTDANKIKANNNTSWSHFFDSFKNATAGAITRLGSDSLEILDGTWMTIGAEKEPESWGAIGKNKANAARSLAGGGVPVAGAPVVEEKPRTPGTIPVVRAILPGGEPWEGGGGMPANADTSAAPKPVAGKTLKPKPTAATVAAPVETEAAESEVSEELLEAAQQAIGEAFTNSKDKSLASIKADAFTWMVNAYDDETAQAFMEAVGSNEAQLALVLDSLNLKYNKLTKKVVSK